MEELIKSVEENFISDGMCLVTQLTFTIMGLVNLRTNWNEFPIKQLSPLCTSCAIICFLLTNMVMVVGKYIQIQNKYYSDSSENNPDCSGQCRMYDHTEMLILGSIFATLRQFPTIIFALKTLRVCLCFQYKDQRKLPNCISTIFQRETIIIAISLAFSLLVGAASLITFILAGSKSQGPMPYEYFCPKSNGWLDLSVFTIDAVLTAVIYILCSNTYKQLDFKKFFFFVFALNNTQFIFRWILHLFSNGFCVPLEITNYHELYYHTLLMQLIGTLLMFRYSQFNKYVMEPPTKAVLDSFESFFNYSTGLNIIKEYVRYLDQSENTKKHQTSLNYYLKLSQIRKMTVLEPANITKYYSTIKKILLSKEHEQKLQGSKEILQKIEEKTLSFGHLKKVETTFEKFCQQLYERWMITRSKYHVKEQFLENLHINSKMRSLRIEIGNND